MNLIVPILYGAVAVGLFAPKLYRGAFLALMGWVFCVMMWDCIRH